jgi:hypothetical protein
MPLADLHKFRQPDPGRLEHRNDRRVTAVLQAPAGACPLQPRKFVAGEDRDGLVRDTGRLHPGRRVRDLLLGGQPLEELLQRPVLVAGDAALYRPSSQATHSCTSCFPTPSQHVRFCCWTR